MFFLRLREFRPGIEPRSPTCDDRIVKLKKNLIESSEILPFFKIKSNANSILLTLALSLSLSFGIVARERIYCERI